MKKWIKIIGGVFSEETWMKEYRKFVIEEEWRVLKEKNKQLEFDNQMLQERVYDLEGEVVRLQKELSHAERYR